jgi:hypothetical protein
MKRALLLIAVFSLLLVNVQRVNASPLVYTVTKEIESEGFVDLGLFDTSKYKQIRINVQRARDKSASRSDYEFSVLIAAVEKDTETKIVQSDGYIDFSSIVDTPPTKIKVEVRGRGTFRLFIWASQ